MEFNYRIFIPFVLALLFMCGGAYKLLTYTSVSSSSVQAVGLSHLDHDDNYKKRFYRLDSRSSAGDGQPVGKGVPAGAALQVKTAVLECVQVDVDTVGSLFVSKRGGSGLFVRFAGFSFECELQH